MWQGLYRQRAQKSGGSCHKDRGTNKWLKILFISEDDNKKILIGEDELLSAFSDIKECVEGSFFDSADEIMEMLEEYRIPDAYKDKYKELKSLMSAVDRDGIIKLL